MGTYLKTLSLKIRLTLLFVTLFGITTSAFALVVYFSLRNSLLQEFDNALYNYSIDIMNSIESNRNADPLYAAFPLLDEDKIFPFSSGQALILIRHASGEVISQTEGFENFELPYNQELDLVARGADATYTNIKLFGSYRLMTSAFDQNSPPEFYLQIAVPMDSVDSQLARMKWIISIGLPLLLLIATGLGLSLASWAMRPLQQLIESTRRIDIHNLSGRMNLPLARDEVRILTETQNHMLDRIEKAFRSQESFIANASHQLRTPLTILKGEIEDRLKSDAGASDFLQSLLQETDKLAKIVKDMLLLARLESGTEDVLLRPVEIDDVLFQVITPLQKIATLKQVQIKVEVVADADKGILNGEEDLLYSLIYNVMENAVKYSPHAGDVKVVLSWMAEATLIDIYDQGPGIKPENVDSIFDRFSRANPHHPGKGFGLGLSIAKKIADLHHFNLDLILDTTAGAHFRIEMPYRRK